MVNLNFDERFVPSFDKKANYQFFIFLDGFVGLVPLDFRLFQPCWLKPTNNAEYKGELYHHCSTDDMLSGHKPAYLSDNRAFYICSFCSKILHIKQYKELKLQTIIVRFKYEL